MSEESKSQIMSPPGAEHDRLKPFLGRFRAEVRIWMGPGDPMVSTGTMSNTLDLGGRFVRQDYRGDPSDGPFGAFEGRGFWGFNNPAKRYEGVWIDTASTVMQFESGSVDDSGKVWTMTGEVPDPQGSLMTKRSIITLQDDDHHKMEMYLVKEGKDIKGMEIDYTRI